MTLFDFSVVGWNPFKAQYTYYLKPDTPMHPAAGTDRRREMQEGTGVIAHNGSAAGSRHVCVFRLRMLMARGARNRPMRAGIPCGGRTDRTEEDS